MNLTTDPWIPVIRMDGRHDEVSLLGAFTEGREIADLSVRPHERIALLRLLICVAQAALDGPDDEEELRDCIDKIVERVAGYLRQWKNAFELFGSNSRFLQMKGVGFPGEMSANKLQFIDKDTTTLFDNEVDGNTERSERWLALGLVTYQSFAAGGKVGGAEMIGGKKRPQSGANAPCRDQNALHVFVRGPTLLSTIHANMLCRAALEERGLKPLVWGKKPVWEVDVGSLADPQVQRQLTGSYLGRLVPLSRAVWLNHDQRTALNANGLTFGNFADSSFREPSCSTRRARNRKTGQIQLKLVSAGRDVMGRALWRQLAALLVRCSASDAPGGAACLYTAPDAGFDVWVGALVADQAKIIDAIESAYTLPGIMKTEEGIQIYEAGVRFADALSRKLTRGVKAFRLAIEKGALTGAEQIEKARKLPRADNERCASLFERASLHYWTAAEGLVPELFRLVSEPPPVRKARYEFAETTWGKKLFRAALDAYEFACPHQTVRQLQAFILGRAQLLSPMQPETEPELEENDSQ